MKDLIVKLYLELISIYIDTIHNIIDTKTLKAYFSVNRTSKNKTDPTPSNLKKRLQLS